MLPVIVQDKANHFIYGSIISTVSMVILYMFLNTHFEHNNLMLVIAGFGVISAILMSIAKEISDYISNKKLISQGNKPTHGVEVKDAIYTALGGVVPAVPVIMVHLIEKLTM